MNRLFYLIALVLVVGTFGCSPESAEKELVQLNSKVSVMESKAATNHERLTIAESEVRTLNAEVRMLREKIDDMTKSKPDSSGDSLSADLQRARIELGSMSERLNRVEVSISLIKEVIAQPVLPGCLGFEDIYVNGIRRRQPCRCMAYSEGSPYGTCNNCEHDRNQHTRFNKEKK